MTVVFVHGNPETPAVWDLLSERLRERGYDDQVRLTPQDSVHPSHPASDAPSGSTASGRGAHEPGAGSGGDCAQPVGAPATTRSRGGERRRVTTDRTDTIADGSPDDA